MNGRLRDSGLAISIESRNPYGCLLSWRARRGPSCEYMVGDALGICPSLPLHGRTCSSWAGKVLRYVEMRLGKLA